MSLYKNRKTPT